MNNLLTEFSLNDLLIFKEVYELKNCSKAAANLKVSLPTINRRIKHLEKYFGNYLFIFKNNSMYSSDLAESLYQEVITILNPVIEQISSLQSKSLNPTDEISGTFRLQLPVVISLHHITPRIPALIAKYPKLKLEILYSNSLYEMLPLKIDFCLTLNKHFAGETESIDKNKNFYGALYCTKEYANKYGIPQNVDELVNHNLVGVIAPDHNVIPSIRFVNTITNQIQIINNPKQLRTNNSEQNIELILSNMFIAPLLTTSKTTIKKMNLDLIHVLPDWKAEYFRAYFIINQQSNKYIANVIKEFLLECLSDI